MEGNYSPPSETSSYSPPSEGLGVVSYRLAKRSNIQCLQKNSFEFIIAQIKS
ncbi:MAG: hypothetical protein LBC74_11530 [Planctomycetaceae bacterium]|nr:hypothetical protein [Planctomycetaceae bacterium]